MFDFAPDRPVDGVPPEIIDADSLAGMLATLDDDQLAALEDDLDFCSFAGVPSARILKLLSEVTDLDPGWRRLLRAESNPDLPEADFSGQRPAVKRANRYSRAFQPLADCA